MKKSGEKRIKVIVQGADTAFGAALVRALNSNKTFELVPISLAAYVINENFVTIDNIRIKLVELDEIKKYVHSPITQTKIAKKARVAENMLADIVIDPYPNKIDGEMTIEFYMSIQLPFVIGATTANNIDKIAKEISLENKVNVAVIYATDKPVGRSESCNYVEQLVACAKYIYKINSIPRQRNTVYKIYGVEGLKNYIYNFFLQT